LGGYTRHNGHQRLPTLVLQRASTLPGRRFSLSGGRSLLRWQRRFTWESHAPLPSGAGFRGLTSPGWSTDLHLSHRAHLAWLNECLPIGCSQVVDRRREGGGGFANHAPCHSAGHWQRRGRLAAELEDERTTEPTARAARPTAPLGSAVRVRDGGSGVRSLRPLTPGPPSHALTIRRSTRQRAPTGRHPARTHEGAGSIAQRRATTVKGETQPWPFSQWPRTPVRGLCAPCHTDECCQGPSEASGLYSSARSVWPLLPGERSEH
jgi:hypothetical protein